MMLIFIFFNSIIDSTNARNLLELVEHEKQKIKHLEIRIEHKINR